MIPKQCLIDDYSVRSVFIAPKGRTLIAADYSQLELRILCQLSRDPKLMDLLNENSICDIFELMSARFNDISNTKTKIDRNKAKQVHFKN